MTYYYLEPEVAGEIGEGSLIDWTAIPPEITSLSYNFLGWMGDALLESFPIFLTTDRVKEALTEIGATGVSFDDVSVTVDDQFSELHPDINLPTFVWLKVDGQAGQDDLGRAIDGRLVVSDRVLTTLAAYGISNALIEPFDSA